MSDDARTSRRALLTGGIAAAGAVAIASDAAKAAPTYMQLNVVNATTTQTAVRSSGDTGFLAISNHANGFGLVGSAPAASGVGVYGGGGTGSGAIGVKGSVASGGSGVAGVSTGNGYGLNGSGGYCGAYGSGGSYGGIFYGNSSGAYGVYASGNNTGVYGVGNSYGVQGAGGTDGVYGSGGSNGVYGTGPIGVYGSGTTAGVYGSVNGNGAPYGVHGESNYRGVYGNGPNAGVYGSSTYVGMWAEGTTYGMFANATDTVAGHQAYGLFAQCSNAASFAVWAAGNMHVTGTVSKAAGSFKIDHPLDPEHKWLQHSFVESPDMMNVYNGNVTTDAAGFAVVKLPAYFDALNRDFRYQLTVIGTMAQAIVDRKIQNNQFRIRTSKGRVEVSWQVTGIRQDDYAKAHPIQVEVPKRQEDQGTRQFLPKGANGRLKEMGPTTSQR